MLDNEGLGLGYKADKKETVERTSTSKTAKQKPKASTSGQRWTYQTHPNREKQHQARPQPKQVGPSEEHVKGPKKQDVGSSLFYMYASGRIGDISLGYTAQKKTRPMQTPQYTQNK